MRETLYRLAVLSNACEETMGKYALYQVLVYCGKVMRKCQNTEMETHIKNGDQEPRKKYESDTSVGS
jgi:hypothetical protein